MKKIIVLMIILAMCFVNNVYANDDSSYDDFLNENNIVAYKSDRKTLTVDGLDYYPFIYSLDNTRKWYNDNIIGDANCEVGYLYTKEMKTGIIREIFNRPVSVFRENKNGIALVYNNSIYLVSYKGDRIECLYNSSGTIKNDILEEFDGNYYLIENNNLVKLNGGKTTIILKNVNIDRLCVKKDRIVYFEGDKGYVLSSNTRKVTNITTVQDYIEALSCENGVEEVEIQRSPSVINQTDTNLANVQSLYPNGSYFTASGTACTHHGSGCSYYGGCNCKAYCGTIQCVAYAKYSSDKYAHLSTWSPVSGDQNDTQTAFNSDSDVKAYFSNMSTASYCRLTRSMSDDNGFHSILFIKNSGTNIQTYECNLHGACKVEYVSRSYKDFREFSPYSSYYVSHHYSNSYASYSSTYHKQYCSSSGCNGYRLEQHYAPVTGSNVICEACGYVGNITVTEPLS